jgi:excisionase family DNA binding protein
MTVALNTDADEATLDRVADTWMTVLEACDRLGVKRSRVYALIAEGRIRAVKSGSIHKVNAADVEDYAATRRWGWPKGKPRKESDDE